MISGTDGSPVKSPEGGAKGACENLRNRSDARLRDPPQNGHPIPRYCLRHNTSGKRPKSKIRLQACRGCQVEFQTSYTEFSFCPACSDTQGRCMICGNQDACSDGNIGSRALPSQMHKQAAGERPTSGDDYERPATLTGLQSGHPPGSHNGTPNRIPSYAPGTMLGKTTAAQTPSKRQLMQGGWREGAAPPPSTSGLTNVSLAGLTPSRLAPVANRKELDLGCGPSCAVGGYPAAGGAFNLTNTKAAAGASGANLMGFFNAKVLDFANWTQCMAQTEGPRHLQVGGDSWGRAGLPGPGPFGHVSAPPSMPTHVHGYADTVHSTRYGGG